MSTYPVKIIDGKRTLSKSFVDILSEVDDGGAIKTLTALEYITERQRNWYRGVCLKALSDWNGDTVEEWDGRLKAMCGAGLLKREKIWLSPGNTFDRLTIKGVGKRNMTQFIEEILSKAVEKGWIEYFGPPDSDLRR